MIQYAAWLTGAFQRRNGRLCGRPPIAHPWPALLCAPARLPSLRWRPRYCPVYLVPQLFKDRLTGSAGPDVTQIPSDVRWKKNPVFFCVPELFIFDFIEWYQSIESVLFFSWFEWTALDLPFHDSLSSDYLWYDNFIFHLIKPLKWLNPPWIRW